MSTESTPSLWRNATFRVSQYRTKDIHRRTEQLSQFKREKERETERQREIEREERQREIERERQFESLREIYGERLQVRHVEITFFDYILPENNPGKLSKQNKLI